KVGGKVLMLDRSLEDTLPYLFALLGIEEQPSPLQQMDPQIRRRRTFEALKKLFLRESLNQPLILIFEDLHWIDGETQGFLDVLSESVASACLLLLTNYRPEYRHEWGQKTYYTQLRLAPLGREEAEEFLDELLGETRSRLPRGERDRERVTDTSLHALKQLILEKTQGTPFFMEEIVQELVEQGVLVRTEVGAARRGRPPEGAASSAPTAIHIPPTVQGVLAARIDRLALEEKALLQQLSVIGREFPVSVVRQVIAQPEADLYRLLASLQRKEFLYEQPAFPEVEYIFKHALTQEVAYGTVLQEQRKLLHERTGQALETVYAATLSEHYGALAHHYSRSANTEKAITYLQLAGQQEVQRSAYTEAISHFTAALDLLSTRPETPERAAQELTLRLAVGPPLQATKGWASPEVEAVYTRARELCQQVGETPQLFPALFGLQAVYAIRGDLQTGRELAEQCFSLAQRVQDPALLLEACHLLGYTLFYRGEFVAVREQSRQAVALYDSQKHHSLALLYGGDDPAGCCLGHDACALWSLGYPDQALKTMHEALTLAQKLSSPLDLAQALSLAARVHQFRGEPQVTQEQAEAGMTLSTEQGFAVFLAWETILRGWVLSEQGQAEEGITQMHQGMAAAQVTGAGLLQTYHLALLAEVHGKAGQIEEGLNVLAEALATVQKTDERFYEAELYRIKGELLLRQSRASLGQVPDKSQASQNKSEVPNT
ncbi:MAG: hypothetical protein HY267_00370, partial [Deltaproteobacteria bacterium]|nr:hypothetical protein [Deltaproteobacteria bacterium]